MIRAVIYARYSSDRQTEQSIEGQVHVCSDYALRNNYVIVDTYIDRAMSGTNDNRDAFQKMILDSCKNLFDVVLVYKLDRFARNRLDSAVNKSVLKKNGVKVVSATEAISDTPEGIILEGLLESMAEYYSAELSQKVKRGMHETRSKGLFAGGCRMYGYQIIDQRYVVDPSEAKIIRKIFKDYIDGKKIKDITKELNEQGIRLTSQRDIKQSRISYILHNEKYTGRYTCNGNEYPNMFPPIIDIETFNEAKRLLDKDKFKNGRYKYKDSPFILSGKIYCANCNSLYVGSGGTSKNGQTHHYYKCSKKIKNTKHCDSKVYRKDELEDFIIDSIKEKLNDDKIMDSIIKNTITLYNNEITENLDLKVLRMKLKEVNSKLDNYTKAIGQGIINQHIKDMMESLSKDKEALESTISVQEALQEKPITYEIVKSYLCQFFKLDNTIKNRRLLVDLFIKKIIIYDNDDIVIICKSHNKSLKTKNEHSNNEMFTFNRNGARDET